MGLSQCNCVSGYIGPACEDVISVCGDGVLNREAGEECDDGNNLIFDGWGCTSRMQLTHSLSEPAVNP
jgi:cysteine-rich repeat protein